MTLFVVVAWTNNNDHEIDGTVDGTVESNHLEALRLPDVMSRVRKSSAKKLATLTMMYSHSPEPLSSPADIWLIHVCQVSQPNQSTSRQKDTGGYKHRRLHTPAVTYTGGYILHRPNRRATLESTLSESSQGRRVETEL